MFRRRASDTCDMTQPCPYLCIVPSISNYSCVCWCVRFMKNTDTARYHNYVSVVMHSYRFLHQRRCIIRRFRHGAKLAARLQRIDYFSSIAYSYVVMIMHLLICAESIVERSCCAIHSMHDQVSIHHCSWVLYGISYCLYRHVSIHCMECNYGHCKLHLHMQVIVWQTLHHNHAEM